MPRGHYYKATNVELQYARAWALHDVTLGRSDTAIVHHHRHGEDCTSKCETITRPASHPARTD